MGTLPFFPTKKNKGNGPVFFGSRIPAQYQAIIRETIREENTRADKTADLAGPGIGNYRAAKDLCGRSGTTTAQNRISGRRNPGTVRRRAAPRDARIRARVRSARPRRVRAPRSGPRPDDTAGRPGPHFSQVFAGAPYPGMTAAFRCP